MTSTIQKIKKRNGNIVPFDLSKIKRALERAFDAIRGGIKDSELEFLTDHVVIHLEHQFSGQVPSVEDVQNIVERVLMEKAYFDVARDYIVYRYEHARVREEHQVEMKEALDRSKLVLVKASGQMENFKEDKLRTSLMYAVSGYEADIDVEYILDQCRSELHDEISTENVAKTLLMTVRSLSDRDPAYSKVAARLLWFQHYKDVLPNLQFENLNTRYQEGFGKYIQEGVDIGRLDKKLLEFDLNFLSSQLLVERDSEFEYLGAAMLHDRYFMRNPETKKVLELPQYFWMRVAMGLAINEEYKEQRALEFYEVMSTLRYIPSTPTLFQSGSTYPQLSSCYLNTVQDDLTNIFKTYNDNAQLSKWSGGIGTDWSNIRATNSLIKGTGVESQGVVPFLKIANDVTVAINRSGKRRGATVAYLETWHLDIEDFLELRKNTGDERRRTHDMNTANWIPDLFMERVAQDGEWTLFSADETPDLHHSYGKEFREKYEAYEARARKGQMKLHKTMKAKDLWRKMIVMLYETGHPWMTWKDACNLRSPQDHVGVVHSSNLCTEITLNTSESEVAVCNLGSVNLSRHIKDGDLYVELLEDTINVAMRMLDNVVDINFYPIPEAKHSNLKHRPVGLGIMGLQDAFYMLGIDFDSEAAVEWSDKIMERVSYYALSASCELAQERGHYETFRNSKWDRGIFPLDTLDLLEAERGIAIPTSREARLDWDALKALVKEHGLRNSNTMAIAPTASISNIGGCCPTIEPIYKNIYVKSNMSGEFTVVNKYLVNDLKKLNLWNPQILNAIKQHDGSIANIDEIPADLKKKYKEVFEIDSKALIKLAAYRGKWIDQSQSLNVFYRGTSGKDLAGFYMYAWEMGLKTTYYLRTLGASNVEKSTTAISKEGLSQHNAKASEPVVQAATQAMQSPASESATVVAQQNEATPAPAASARTLAMRAAKTETVVKLCRIEDPDCEACQ